MVTPFGVSIFGWKRPLRQGGPDGANGEAVRASQKALFQQKFLLKPTNKFCFLFIVD
jgi:hypothetical protein